MSVAKKTGRLSLQFALLRGRLRKRLLSHAERFAYRVAGLPMALPGNHRPAPEHGEPADFLHGVYRAHYWRWPTGPLKAAIAAITWPFALAGAIFHFTSRNGTEIRARTGKSIGRQVFEQARLASSHAIAPPWYYMFELFEDERKEKATLYLTAHETIAAAYTLLEPRDGADAMADKVWFAGHCSANGIAAVPVLFYASAGRIRFPRDGAAALPDVDLFVKPRRGDGGHNAERWDKDGKDSFRNSRGETLAREALLDRLASQSLKEDYVVQPRLINHPALDDISNGALATVRVLTCRNERNEFEATNFAFRMAVGTNCVVDNFHRGGLAAPVDAASGRIGMASDMGTRPQMGWRDIHPVSGARFTGRILPFWPDVVALACHAHRIFPQRTAVGWDIAMLRDGPCIVEGNGKPDLDIHQRVERRPLGDQRIAELLALNLRRLSSMPTQR